MRLEFKCSKCGWSSDRIGEKHHCELAASYKSESRKAKLEKALEFKADDTVKSEASILYEQGRKNENRRLALLHVALIEAIENLEDIQAWCRDRAAQHTITNMKCLSLSTEALAKIDEALEGMG